MRAASLSASSGTPGSKTRPLLPAQSSSLSREVGRLRIRDSFSSSTPPKPQRTLAQGRDSFSSSSRPAASLTSSPSLPSSSSRSRTGSASSPGVPGGPRRRLSSLDLSSGKEAEEQKTSGGALMSGGAPPAAGGRQTVMRRRLSVMNSSDSSQHLDGTPDPKQTREASLRSAKSPTAASAAAATVLPAISRAHGRQRTLSSTSSSASLTGAAYSSSSPLHSSHPASPDASSALSASASAQSSFSSPPRRLFSHYASLSKVGYIPYNPAKVNQDRAVELLRFNQSERQALFAVFDGHGALGHEVSTYLTQELPRQLSRTATASAGSELTAQVTKAFTDTNALLAQTSRIDCTFSGSTGIVCWMREHKLYTCNVGDSRAVLCRRQPIVPPASAASTSSSSLPAASFSAFSYTAVGLSVDQKPDRPDERRRILAQHGRVEACKGSRGEDIGPARVWIQGQDVPGLAMSRSFGDLIAASVGVTARPEVDERELDDSDVFIVLGSDGVWEFLSNDEVVELVVAVGGAAGERVEDAARAVVDEATRRWNREEEVVDDITCVIVYF